MVPKNLMDSWWFINILPINISISLVDQPFAYQSGHFFGMYVHIFAQAKVTWNQVETQLASLIFVGGLF
jgi:hypothetical protein